MGKSEGIFTLETFRFFRDLARNNKKVWMDANRERYQECVVQPFRRLLEELSPVVLELNARFDTTARNGTNFSRINRDIRFAKDKTPYRPQMYLKFCVPFPGEGDTGELYAGLSKDTVTAGFRVYGGKRKLSALAMIADPRLAERPRWLAEQKKKLGRKYESYWYAAEKKEWKQRDGWPASPEEFKTLQGWIVRKKCKPGDATRATFPREVEKIFRDVYPLLKFTCLSGD
jgi:uncharacterized protein (TIGR02453 family)